MRKQMDMWEYIDKLEKIEYNLFKNWFKDYPNLRNPETGITSSLARNMARIVYDKLKKEKDRWQDERSRMAKKLFEKGVKSR